MKNVFKQSDVLEILERINKLTPDSQRLWGKMTVSQMLAHCSVTYEMLYETKHPKPGAFMRLILKLLVKNTVVSEKPYKKNTKTAPAFIMTDEKDFNTEKSRLIEYINRTYQMGEKFFDNKESNSFGKLTINEWNNMFYKHLDHHLGQFGV